MPLNLASPGIVVREVDLTQGRIDSSTNKTGGMVGAFAQGPVELPTLVGNENDLLNNFGQPYGSDKQYETWMVASSFLAYGGSLRIVRADDDDLKNAVDSSNSTTSIKIKSTDHYEELGYDENVVPNVIVTGKNPGSWANGIRVAILDCKADQILELPSTGIATVGLGVTQAISSVLPGVGAGTTLDGVLKGIITQVEGAQAYIKVVSHVSAAGTETAVDYQQNGIYQFGTSNNITVVTNAGVAAAHTSVNATADWFDQQTLATSTNNVGVGTSVATIQWNILADRPGTSDYASARGSRFDELHVVVLDGDGKITGNAGTVLEKHLNLSKAKDAEFSVGSPAYWRKYLKTNSNFIFGGGAPTGLTTTGFSAAFTEQGDFGWDQNAKGIIFGATGKQDLTLVNGKDYNGASGIGTVDSLKATVSKLSTGYQLFQNNDAYAVDFLLMGSGNHGKTETQNLAQQVIAVADIRKDAVAFISPYRGAFINDSSAGSVTVNNDVEITSNVLSFYSPLTSSSYAVFDSGYKYMYDRFADTFRYVPLNGDIAGTCVRTDINSFPWFSPAGTARGAILNAVKLTYNPSKEQRDVLYSNRINPVVFQAGSGIVLFGDKTALAKSSAFDRINVRRLFIYLENAIEAAARDQLFEFNDEITRTNFVNIVEPFLRDVTAKRGIQDYVVVCDETNNTAAIIDNNEFVADIYVKPARSINFIGLTFVATRTGVSFEEVIGSV
jgi:phage tail sheath protein FI